MEDNTNKDVSKEQPIEKMEHDEKLTGSKSLPEVNENANSSKKANGTEGKPIEKMEHDEKLTGSKSLPEMNENANSSEKATGTEGKPEPSTMASKTTSGIELESKPSTSSAAEIPYEILESKSEEKNGHTGDPTGESSPNKVLSNLMRFFSKSKNKTGTKPKKIRSKSFPPSDKSLISKNIINPVEACTSQGAEHSGKDVEKTGMFKSIRRGWKNFKTKMKSSDSSEKKTLVYHQETDQSENALANVTVPEKKPIEVDADLDKSIPKPKWIDPKSYTEKLTYDGTTKTDFASCSTKPSKNGENTSADVDSAILDSSLEGEPPAA